MGGQSPLARAAHRRLAAARRRAHQPHRVRQGSRRPLDRRAVRARLRRQQADHPDGGQRAAQRRAARPLALHHRGTRPHVRGEADRGRSAAKAGRVRSVRHGGGPPDPKIKPKLQEALDKYRSGTRPHRAGQPGHSRQRADAGRPLRHPRRDEAALRLCLARPRARRHDDVRRGVEPGVRRDGTPARWRRSTPSTPTRSTPASRSIRPRSPTNGRAPASSSWPPTPPARSSATSSRARRRPTSAPPFAREPATGLYDSGRESRMVASTGKIIAAIAIANTLARYAQSLYLDTKAPAQGLETCAKGEEHHGRRALVAFACSLNDPLMRRTAQVGQARVQKLDRRSRLQHAADQCRRQRNAAVDRRRPRPDRSGAAPRAPHVRHRAGQPDRPRRDAAASADADQALRLHQCRRPCRAGNGQSHAEQDHPHRRPRLRTLGPAGAALLRGRRQAAPARSRICPAGARRAARA